VILFLNLFDNTYGSHPLEHGASLPENGDCYAVRDERILLGSGLRRAALSDW
jgi:hypothetical protein